MVLSINVLQILQDLMQSQVLFKIALLILLAGYLILQLIIFIEINSMEKIITQPLSTAFLRFLVFALLGVGIILFIAVVNIKI